MMAELLFLNALTLWAAFLGFLPADGLESGAGFLYVGTYSARDGEGILCATFDQRNGSLGELRPTGGIRNPAFLAIHPSGNFLYATTTVADTDGTPTGAIAAFAIDDKTGELREIDRRPSGGTGPCHLAVDSQGGCLVVANCGTATVACLALSRDGRFGESSTVIRHKGVSVNSEQKAQAHSINIDGSGRYAIAADLGLDRLFVYRLDAARALLTPHDPPFTSVAPGAGPRHLAFHPEGDFVYAVNELGNTVTAFSFDGETGMLQTIQDVSTLPMGFAGESFAAEVRVHPGGRFLYASNRGHDSLAVFAIDSATGRLDPKGHTPSQGSFPRNFTLDPSGNYLIVANQKSDNLVVFHVDPQTGRLEAAGEPIPAPQPVCVRIRTCR